MKVLNAAAVVIAMLGAAARLPAQGIGSAANPAHFGIAAGISIPTGDFSNDVDNGYNVTALLELDPPALPLAFRLDGSVNSFNFHGGGGSGKISAGTANVLLNVPITGIKPYVIGGIGYYHETGTVNGIGSASANHFGVNVGAGIKLPLSGFDTFLEARWHRVTEDNGITPTTFIPITFGVIF